jgi:hypothetical protein
MLGIWKKGGGVLGAALAVVVSARAGQGGLDALNSLLNQSNPLSSSSLGRSLTDIWANMRPYSIKVLLLAALVFLLIQSREFILDLLRPIARRLLDLPEDEPLVFMELTFPADTSKAAFATRQLFMLLNAGMDDLNWLERLALRPKRYSLELVAGHEEGIRFIIAIPVSESMAIHSSLLSYLPGLMIRETADYLGARSRSRVRTVDLRLTGDLVLPLKSQGEQRTHDPIAFIAGQMDQLGADELIAYQVVVSPVTPVTHPKIMARRQQLQLRLMAGLPISSILRRPTRAPRYLVILLWILDNTILLLVRELVGGPRMKFPPDTLGRDSPQPLSDFEKELSKAVGAKVNDALFAANIRVLVMSPHRSTAAARLNAALTPFRFFTNSEQSLVPVRLKRNVSKDKLPELAYAKRILGAPVAKPTILIGTSELADLYHFPDTSHAGAPRFLKTRSAELPMPLSFENAMQPGDALYGANLYGSKEMPIKIPYDQRARHTYVFGRTGTGKTTMLTRAIYEDIAHSEAGVAVLDPHGDMFKHLLGTIPAHRRDKLVVFDPSERDWPVGINLLNPGIRFKDDIERRDRITSAVIAVFQKLSGDFWGPRMEHILSNATLTALSLPDPNLYTLQRLLTQRDYQEEVADGLDDPVLKQFWQYELSLAGDYQLSSITSPLTTRLGKFITTGMSRHILMQKHTTISMSDVMDEGKILLVNLSKGELGEDQSSFFGTIVSSFIWMAALARANIQTENRHDFYVYVDEFQNFATRNFSEIVSEGRKYNIALTLAHQSVAQITDPKLLKVIAGNAGTIISFAGSPDDEAFLQPFMAPVVKPGDILGLPPHHFLIKAKDIPGADAFTGVTASMESFPESYSRARADQLTAQSNHTYGVSRVLLDQYFTAQFDAIDRANKAHALSKVGRKKHARRGRNRKANAAQITQPAVNVAAAQMPFQGRQGDAVKSRTYDFGELTKQAPSAGSKND